MIIANDNNQESEKNPRNNDEDPELITLERLIGKIMKNQT